MARRTPSSLGFPPIASPDGKVLILGTLPGPRSLAMHEYYAHPRNAFWPIMSSLFGPFPEGYGQRTLALSRAGIAVWDVLAAAPREGALDSRIEVQRAVPNDFAAFYHMHPQVRMVCFNGAGAARLYRTLVSPVLGADVSRAMHVLPSTSPAHAIPFETKRNAWANVLDQYMRGRR